MIRLSYFILVGFLVLNYGCKSSSENSYKPFLTEKDYQDYQDYQKGVKKLSKMDCSVLSINELLDLYKSQSRHQWLESKKFMLTLITKGARDPKITSNLDVLPTSSLEYDIECNSGITAKMKIKEDSGDLLYNIRNKNYVEAKKLREVYKEEAMKIAEQIDNSHIGLSYVFKKDDYYIVIHKQVQARLPIAIGKNVSFR